MSCTIPTSPETTDDVTVQSTTPDDVKNQSTAPDDVMTTGGSGGT